MKKSILICFLGMDGSGKTTLSRYLYEELRKRNYDVLYIWWLEGENSLFREFLRKLKKFGKSVYSPKVDQTECSRKRDKPIVTKLFRAVYPKFVLIDYLKFGIIKVWLPRIVSKSKIIILDRYIYDVILAISKEFSYSYPKMIRLLKIYSKLLPSPDLIFTVDVPPEVAYSRKKEELHTIEDARKIWKHHQNLHSMLSTLSRGKIVKVDNSQSLEAAKAKVLKTALEIVGDCLNG